MRKDESLDDFLNRIESEYDVSSDPDSSPFCLKEHNYPGKRA